METSEEIVQDIFRLIDEIEIRLKNRSLEVRNEEECPTSYNDRD